MRGTKAKDTFERVYEEVNRRKSCLGKTLPKSDLAVILAQLGVDKKHWGSCLLRARKVTPNLHELLYRAFGQNPPSRRARDEEPAAAEAVEEPETPHAPADILANVVAWLEKAESNTVRRRILLSADVFFDTKNVP